MRSSYVSSTSSVSGIYKLVDGYFISHTGCELHGQLYPTRSHKLPHGDYFRQSSGVTVLDNLPPRLQERHEFLLAACLENTAGIDLEETNRKLTAVFENPIGIVQRGMSIVDATLRNGRHPTALVAHE